jgi:hypothetical protein
MRLSGVIDTIFAIFKCNVANYQHRRVREASKTELGTSVWVTVGACEWELAWYGWTRGAGAR